MDNMLVLLLKMTRFLASLFVEKWGVDNIKTLEINLETGPTVISFMANHTVCVCVCTRTHVQTCTEL